MVLARGAVADYRLDWEFQDEKSEAVPFPTDEDAARFFRQFLSDAMTVSALRSLLIRSPSGYPVDLLSDDAICDEAGQLAWRGLLVVSKEGKAEAKADVDFPWSDAEAACERWVGRCSHLHLDYTGNVVVGVGTVVSGLSQAQALPFVLRAGGRRASRDLIAADFQAVTACPKGHRARYYERFTKLDLPNTAISSLLRAELTRSVEHARKRFPLFDTFPHAARLALVDLMMDLGPAKFEELKPLVAAVDRRIWRRAASECRRVGVQEARNTWTREQFLEAADA